MKAWVVPALCLIACGGTDAPPQDTSLARPRGVFQGQATKPQGEAPAAAAQPVAPQPAFPQAQAEPITPKPEAVPEQKPEERDLNAELLAAVGSPADCLKPRTGEGAPTSLRIQIDATVVETGLVTRSYTHSSQLDAEELQCLNKRVSSLRLRAPIDQAPRSLSATLELTAKTPENSAN